MARDDPRCPARNRTPGPAVSHEFNVMTLSSIPAPRIPSTRYATADTRDYAIAVWRHSRDTCSLATLPRDSPHLPMARRTSMTRTSMTRPLTPPRPRTRPRPARSCPSFPRSCTTGCGPPTCRAPPLSSPSAPPPACHSLPRRRPHGPATCPCRCWAARRRREPPAAWGGCVPGLTPVRLAHCGRARRASGAWACTQICCFAGSSSTRVRSCSSSSLPCGGALPTPPAAAALPSAAVARGEASSEPSRSLLCRRRPGLQRPHLADHRGAGRVGAGAAAKIPLEARSEPFHRRSRPAARRKAATTRRTGRVGRSTRPPFGSARECPAVLPER